jgi:hypothetical protein
MNRRTHAQTTAEATLSRLGSRAAACTEALVSELQAEWRSRPLIRHLSALALCLLVVLVGVLERSTKRVSIETVTSGMGRSIVAPQVSPRGAAVAEGRLTALSRARPPASR